MFKYGGITEKGLVAIGKALAGKKLIYTRMEYGDGELTGLADCTTEDKLNEFILTVSGVQNKVADLTMYSATSKNKITTVVGNIIYESVQADFRPSELAVYAKMEGEEEFLIAYFTAITYFNGEKVDTTDYISKESLYGQDHRAFVNITTGNTSNIKVEYTGASYVTKEDFDAEVSFMQKFDHVVDSDLTLAEWASSNGEFKTVLIKAGTYTLNDRMVNILKTGTKYIKGIPGAKLIFNYQKGLGVGEESDLEFIIEDVDIEVNNETEYDGYGIYYGGIVRGGSVKVNSNGMKSFGYMGCSLDDVKGVASGTEGYAFYNCHHCTKARAGGVSTTATWGGANTFIDADTCDIA